MNRMHWITAGVAVAVLAACGDDPVSPTMRAVGPVQFTEHLWQAGASDTWHGYYAPALSVEEGPQLCATWTDFESLEEKLQELGVDMPSGNPPNHYSYDYDLFDHEADEWTDVATVNGDPDNGMTACLDLSAWEPGTYDFRVKGIAHAGFAQNRTNHHTDHAFIQVVIGGLRFEVELRSANTLFTHAELDNPPSSWDIQFVVRLWDSAAEAFVLVTDCDDLAYGDITSSMVWTDPLTDPQAVEFGTPVSPECALGGGPIGNPAVYKVSFDNPFQAQDGSGYFEFTIAGSTNENDVTFETGSPGGGSANGGVGGARAR